MARIRENSEMQRWTFGTKCFSCFFFISVYQQSQLCPVYCDKQFGLEWIQSQKISLPQNIFSQSFLSGTHSLSLSVTWQQISTTIRLNFSQKFDKFKCKISSQNVRRWKSVCSILGVFAKFIMEIICVCTLWWSSKLSTNCFPQNEVFHWREDWLIFDGVYEEKFSIEFGILHG